MLQRLFVVMGIFALSSVGAYSQPSTKLGAPEICRAVSAEPLPVLQERRQILEREIARKMGEPAANSKADKVASSAGSPDADKTLRTNQEDLLEVIFDIDCLQARRQTRGVQTSAPNQVIEVSTYYATNRRLSGSSEPMKVYGSEVNGRLEYGRATVTIPPNHTPGALEMPSLWKLEREPDASKQFVLTGVLPLNADAARKEMAEKLKGMTSKALLIFVHGYNSSFADAALRTAQMAHDLEFPGMAFFYSWPSAASVRGYWQDEETARLSESVFEQLVEELSQLPVTDIYLVAHSMGNRIVGHALQSRMDKGKEMKQLREVLLAAPDINTDIFRTVIAPKLAAMRNTRTTVYAASSDVALRASKIVHGYRRVGETSGGIFTYPGLETVDASSASTYSKNLGHSYIVDSSSVLKDIRAIIHERFSAERRGLNARGSSPNAYWRLP
jgi:esterase/lipase superfamily enzyme